MGELGFALRVTEAGVGGVGVSFYRSEHTEDGTWCLAMDIDPGSGWD